MIQPEDYMHAAAERETNNNLSKTATCSVNDRERVKREYEDALRKEGLSAEDLGFGAVISRTSAVLIGFFTSFVYIQISGIVQGARTWQMAAISLSVTLVALAAERFYLDTVGASSFSTSRSWALIWMQFMRFFTIIMVFLTTNFGLAVFTEMTKTAQLTWFEAIALVFISMLAFFYFMNAYKHSST